MPKGNSKKNTKVVNVNVQTSKKNRRRRFRRRRRIVKPFRRPRVRNSLTKNAYRFYRSELWYSGKFEVPEPATTVIHKKMTFDVETGPVWFRKLCTMYEKYAVRFVRIRVVFGGSSMTKGNYTMTYNTNYADKNENPSLEKANAQYGSKMVRVANGRGTMVIPKRGLTGYKTTLSTTAGQGSYAFDFDLCGIVAEEVNFNVYIDYVVSFYTPQIVEGGGN